MAHLNNIFKQIFFEKKKLEIKLLGFLLLCHYVRKYSDVIENLIEGIIWGNISSTLSNFFENSLVSHKNLNANTELALDIDYYVLPKIDSYLP